MRRQPFYDIDTYAIIGLYFLTILIVVAGTDIHDWVSAITPATFKSCFIFLPSWVAIFRDASNRTPLFCIGLGQLVCVQFYLLHEPIIFDLWVVVWCGALLWALVSRTGAPPKVLTAKDLEDELAKYSYLLSQNSISQEEFEAQKSRIFGSVKLPSSE